MTAHCRTATEQLNDGKIITNTEDYNCCRIMSAVFWSDCFLLLMIWKRSADVFANKMLLGVSWGNMLMHEEKI